MTSIVVDFSKADSRITSAIRDRASDLDAFFTTLSLVSGTRLHPRRSAIVFDEVQLFPPARQMIKHLVADGRYDYIETGSLISLKRNVGDILVPSEEEHLDMPPMDFEEFRWAFGDEATVPTVRERFEARAPMTRALHETAMERFREYMLVGGMPQAVAAYADSRDFGDADRAKREILRLYRDDIAKFAKGYEARVRALFDAIPEQLSRKEKKYRLSSIRKEARFREYEDAFTWLDDARVVNPCLNATEPTAGLGFSAEHATQKLYMGDTGLLTSLYFDEDDASRADIQRLVLYGSLEANLGMVMENLVAQMIVASGRKLYFYARSDNNDALARMEIDFLIAKSGIGNRHNISALEVKKTKRITTVSLDKFRNKFADRLARSYIVHAGAYSDGEGAFRIPVYMLPFELEHASATARAALR